MSSLTKLVLQASVIFYNYTQERWEDLKAAVTSIQHQETPAVEIILLIDHNAELLEMAHTQFPDITLLENNAVGYLASILIIHFKHATISLLKPIEKGYLPE
jgi:hypothetical protein